MEELICRRLNRLIYRIRGIIFSKRMLHCGENLIVSHKTSLIGVQYFSFGQNCFVGKDVYLECIDSYQGEKFSPSLVLGDGAFLGDSSRIGCVGLITIGDNFTSGRRVSIIDHNHGFGHVSECEIPPLSRKLCYKGPVEIGNNVWVGENVVILSGVRIGDNVTIGANSVVTTDIPDNTIACGAPCRVVRMK